MFDCEICDKQFTTTNEKVEHFKSFHGYGRKKYKCCECDSIFSKKYHLKNHEKEKHFRLDFACELCKISFTHKCSMDRHFKNFHGPNKLHCKTFKCDKCDSIFIRKHQLHSHTIIMHLSAALESFNEKKPLDQDEKAFQNGETTENKCDSCDTVFLDKEKLNIHKKKMHHPLICGLCGKSFTQKSAWVIHVNNSHITKKTKQYMCSVCDRVFLDRDKLKVHKKFDHKLTCDLCEKSYLDKTSWVKHVNKCDGFATLNYHKKVVPIRFNCKLCKKSYTKKFDLVRHSNFIHGADKNKYKCELCNKFYWRRDFLNAHNRTKHPNVAFELDDEALVNQVDALSKDSLHEDQLSTDIKIENEVLQETYLSGFGSSKGVPGNNFSAIGNESRISRCVEEAFDCMRQLIGKKAMQDQYSLYGDHIGNQIRSSGRNDKEIYIAKQLINDVIEQLSLDNSLFKS